MIYLIFSKSGGNAKELEHTALGTKENTVSEADKNFTFKVVTVEELSETDMGNQWKPFPSAMQSSELPKVICCTRIFF